MNKFILMGLLFAATGTAVVGQTAQAVPLNGKITLDGKLTEEAWSKASSNQLKSMLFTQGNATAATDFKVLAGADALYIGITCAEPMMDKIKINEKERGGAVFLDDSIEVFIDPTNRRVNYYHLALSANNVQTDIYRIEGGANFNEYGGFWESAVFRGKDFWSAEIRIPYRSFFNTASSEFNKEWAFNLCRGRQPVNELTSWGALKLGFHHPKLYGTLTGCGAKKAADDLRVDVVGCDSITQNADGSYTGEIQISMDAAKEAAGKYLLELVSPEFYNYQTNIDVAAGKNTVTVNNVKIKEPGKFSVAARLTRNGELFGRYYSVLVKYSPVEIVFNEPFYRNNFYPGQPHDKINGKVKINLPQNVLDGSKVVLNIKGAGLAQQVEYPVKSNTINFEFDAAKMVAGKALIAFKLISAGGKVMFELNSAVGLLEKRDKTTVWVDRGQNMVVDGKPIIVRGWHGGPGSGYYAVSTAFLENHTPPNPNLAEGGWLFAQPEGTAPQYKGEITKNIKPSPQVFEAYKKLIEDNRNKNFYWYYLSDEPECRSVSAIYLKYLYDFIKELDPYHPVVITSREPKGYVDACDILSSHPYINPRLKPNFKRDSMSIVMPRNMWKDCQEAINGRPVVFTLCPQAFNYSFRDILADNPDFDETNTTIWSGIVFGAKGVVPYLYSEHTSSIGMRNGFDSCFESLKALEPILVAPETISPVKVECTAGMADAMLKIAGDKVLLIVVNPDTKPAKALVSADALKKIDKLFVFRGGSETMTPANGKLEFNLAPLEVKILTNPVMDQGLITNAQLRAKIAAEQKAIAKTGNILFGRGREIEFTWSKCVEYEGTAVAIALTDGIPDAYGCKQASGENGMWLQMVFPTFVPKFSKAVIYGNALSGAEFMIWKEGKWLKLEPAAVKLDKYRIELDFGKQFKTIKIKIVLPNARSNGELYEVELY